LVKHPLVKAVGFTGSRRGGRALMDAAAARLEPIPVFAEMGSINPMFLLADVLAQRAEEIAAGLHGSVTMGVGQFCTSPGLVFVESSRGATDFLAKLQSLMAHSPAGTMLTAGLCSAYRHGVETISQVPGVKTLTGIAADSGEGKAQVHAALFLTDVETFLHTDSLMNEVFGPSTLVVECETPAQMVAAAERVEGQLTATIFATPAELADSHKLIDVLQAKAGRILFNGYPTGVEVAHAMTHGGPYPATADGRSSSVGTRAIERFLRPVTFQNFPDEALPEELQELNPFRILRLQDGVLVVPSAIE
jgi:NADP-dependent aldehyde dehydrogenase